MNIEFILITAGFIVVFVCLFLTYRYLVSLDEYALGMAALLQRTLEEYYKSEYIQPLSIQWGIDLVWKPNDKDDEDDEDPKDSNPKKGFVTIYYGKDSGIDTPIDDVVEADILSQKIIKVIDKHIQDKKMGLIK